MSKILITGGAGFIGAHVAKTLIDQGNEVILLDNFDDHIYAPSYKKARVEGLFASNKRPKLIVGNILDANFLNTVFSEESFDKVVHFAALPNPAMSVHAADLFTMVNVNGTLNVLDAAVQHDIVQFIFAGSSSIYDDEYAPFREDSPIKPCSPYGASKVAAEAYCSVYHELYGLHVTILRFFSVYGPWGRPDMAPMIFASKILRGQQLHVTQDRKRDLTYIDDIVQGVVAAFDQKMDFEVINLGRGEAVELMDFVNALEDAAGKKARVLSREPPPGEVRITSANIDKARRLLNFNPKVSIKDGAQRLVRWMNNNEGTWK